MQPGSIHAGAAPQPRNGVREPLDLEPIQRSGFEKKTRVIRKKVILRGGREADEVAETRRSSVDLRVLRELGVC
jgi:hypothetical protein